MEEPKFMYDETQEDIAKLNNIIKTLQQSKHKKESKEAKILKKFITAMYQARKPKIKKEQITRPIIPKFQYYKPKLLSRLRQPRFFNQQILPQQIIQKNKTFIKQGLSYPIIKIRNYILVSALINNFYILKEPELTDIDARIVDSIKSDQILSEDSYKTIIKEALIKFKIPFNEDYYEKIKYFLIRSAGLGSLIPLLKDVNVSTIICNGIKKQLVVVYRGKQLETNIIFHTLEELNSIIKKLAKLIKQQVSEFEPLLEGNLPIGYKVNATLGSEIVTPKFIIKK